MCIVSMVSDGFLPRTNPDWTKGVPSALPTIQPQITIGGLDAVSVLLLNQAIKRLDEMDKRMGLRECKDEAKEKFLNELAVRVAQVEKDLAAEKKAKLEARAALLRIAAKRKTIKERKNNARSKKAVRYR